MSSRTRVRSARWLRWAPEEDEDDGGSFPQRREAASAEEDYQLTSSSSSDSSHTADTLAPMHPPLSDIRAGFVLAVSALVTTLHAVRLVAG